MATSTYKGYVRFDASSQVDNAEGVWSGIARDHLVNNANHIADEQAQVLCNWSMSTTGTYLTPTLSGGALVAANTYYRVTRLGPFPLLMKASGTSYQLRGRLRFFASNAATITGRVVCCAPEDSIRVRDSSTATNAMTFTSTATADAWDDADTDNLMSLSVEDMILCMDSRSALAAVSGASITVPIPMPIVDIYVKSTSTTSVPRVSGFYLAEYVGT